MPEPLESGDELRVVHGDLTVKDEPRGVQLAERGHDAWEPAGAGPAVPAASHAGPRRLRSVGPPAPRLLLETPHLPAAPAHKAAPLAPQDAPTRGQPKLH